MNPSKLSLFVLAASTLGSLATAQIDIPPAGAVNGYGSYGDVFSIDGLINTTAGTNGLLSADFRIDFIGSDISTVNSIVVTVANTSTADSLLAAFYLKKPVSQTPSSLDNTNSVPDDWTRDTSLDTQFNNFVNSDFGLGTEQEKSDFRNSYFGAYAGTRLPDGTYSLSTAEGSSSVTAGEVGQFWFDFDESFSISEWAESMGDDPMFFARWQNVNYSDDDFDFSGDSGKGYGGAGFDPSVPEPSEVALIAMLGLGGLLWGRKRFKGLTASRAVRS